jgi:surface antigen
MHYGVDKIHRGMLGAEGCGQIRESQSTQSLELRFRALLTESGVERVEWARV